MSSPHHASRLNVPAFAAEGEPLVSTTLLQNMERLEQELSGLKPDSTINWQARAELRPSAGDEADIWLRLTASASVPLTCQRCMGTVAMPLEIDQWFRFVATEAIAMEQDDASEEDLLVMEPQFDLLAVLEDELLMALPLVPMHDVCPDLPVFSAGVLDMPKNSADKPNPFAALAQLKKK